MGVSEAVPPVLVQTEQEDPFPPLAGLRKRQDSHSSNAKNGSMEIPLPPISAPNPSNGAGRDDHVEAEEEDEEEEEEVEEGEIRAVPLVDESEVFAENFPVENLPAFSAPSIPMFGEFEEAPAPAGEGVPILQSAAGFEGAFGSGFEGGSALEISRNGALEGGLEAENNHPGSVEIPIVASEPASAPPSAAGTTAGYAPKRRVFYLARIPRSVDNKLWNEIRMAEMQVEAMNKNRDYYRVALQLKRAQRSDVVERLRPVRERERGMREAMQQTRAEMEPFQQALSDFRTTFTSGRGQAAICSSEAELDERIGLLRHRMEHESIPLKEEKLILKEIKRLEGTRAQVCQNTISQAELLDRYGPKQDIQDNCRSIGVKLDVIRNEHKQLRAELEVQEKEIQESNKAMDELRQQMEKADHAQREAYMRLRELKRRENASNNEFFQNRRDIQIAKGFVFQKKMQLVEEHCNNQVERIMAMWNNDEKFRSAYMKNNERSTLRRLETLDGRSLGPDEEPPLLASDVDTNLEGLHSSLAMEKTHPNAQQASGRPKESAKAVPKKELASSAVNVVVNLAKEPEKHTDRDLEPVHRSKPSASSNIDGAKAPPPPSSDRMEERAKKEAEAAELKEKRRQEEKAKADEAAERKKRRAEKNEAKAKIRAQKEAERREKEREKKAKKKVVASAAMGEVSESANNENSALLNTRDSVGSEDLSSASTQETSSTRKAPINRKKPVVKPVLKKPKGSKGAVVMPKSKPSYSLWVLVTLLAVIVIALLVFVIGFSKYP